MSDNPRRDDLPPFPYGDAAESSLNGGMPDLSSASAQPQDFSHVTAKSDAAVPSVGDAVTRFAKASDAQSEAIRSLSESVAELASTVQSQSPESETEPPQIDLSRVAAGLDRIYSAITANSQTKAPSARSAGESKPWNSPSIVPGNETGRDGVDAKLRSGEYVMRPEAVKAHGVDFMDRINAQVQKPPEKHFIGGLVGRMAGTVAGGVARAAGSVNRAGRAAGQAIKRASRPIRRGVSRMKRAYRQAAGQSTTPGMNNSGSSFANYAQSNQGMYTMHYASQTMRGGGMAGQVAGGAMSGAMMGASAGAPGMLIGAAAGAVVSAFNSVGEAAKSAANRLQMYDANIAEANANAEHRQVHGDIARSAVVGKDVAQYTDTTSRIGQTGQNLEAILLKAGLTVINPILEILEPMLAFMTDVLKFAIADIMEILSKIAPYLDGYSTMLDPIAKALSDGAMSLRQMVIQGEPKGEGVDVDAFMDRFLKGHGTGNDRLANAVAGVNIAPPRAGVVVNGQVGRWQNGQFNAF